MPFNNIGPMELVIVLVIALIVIGPKRLPEVGKSLGKGMREFKDSLSGDSKDDEDEVGTRILAVGRRIDHVRHAELHDELRALLEQLPRIVGTRRLKLADMAQAARAELKQDRLEAAAKAVAALRAALAETS